MNERSIREGLKNILRSFWLSATAISVLIVSIGSVVLVSNLRTGVDFTLRQFDKKLSIVAYIDSLVEEDTIKSLQQEIEDLSKVSKVVFVSKDQDKEKIQKNEKLAEGFNLLEENPFRDSFHVTPTSSKNYEVVVSILKSDQYNNILVEVDDKQDVIDKLETVYWWTSIVGIGLIVIFALIAVLVMINILRISIYSYKSEIEIMRLVGATNKYIRGPFVVQGAFFSIFASIVIVLGAVPTIQYLFVPWVQDLLNITLNEEIKSLLFDMYFGMGIVIITAILVSTLTSFLATKKYLKL